MKKYTLKHYRIKYKSVFILIIIFCLIFSGCVKLEPNPSNSVRTSSDVIREIVSQYSKDGTFNEDTDALFDELYSLDERKADLWRNITDYWDYANHDMPINDYVLPDGLSNDHSFAIVVLGFELNPDGSMQDELIGRLETALNCSEKYPEAFIVCTGGGTAANNKSATEAGQMAAWLKDKGIDERRIIIEDKSMSTIDNARYTFRILSESYPEVCCIAIVSSSYHIPWGALLFEAVFQKIFYENGGNEMHVVSNAAYPFINERYAPYVLQYQSSQLMQLID